METTAAEAFSFSLNDLALDAGPVRSPFWRGFLTGAATAVLAVLAPGILLLA